MDELMTYLPIGLSTVACIGLGIVIILQIKTQTRLNRFFTTNDSLNLEDALIKQMNQLNEHDSHISMLKDLTQDMDVRFKKGFNKVGIERFNPFQETGGDQSFILVLLNDFDNGFIISSLHSRENTRVYAKEILKGKSTRKLSNEEERLLNSVIKNAHAEQSG